MLNVIFVRGLPGAGKTRFSSLFELDCYLVICEADQFMVDEKGKYAFDPARLPEVHGKCLTKFTKAMENAFEYPLDLPTYLVVSNTFSQKWELAPYLKVCQMYEVTPVIIDLFDQGLTDEELAARNLHGVPVQTIRAMRARWER